MPRAQHSEPGLGCELGDPSWTAARRVTESMVLMVHTVPSCYLWWLAIGLVGTAGCAALAGFEDEYTVGSPDGATGTTTTAAGTATGTAGAGGTSNTGTGGTSNTGTGGTSNTGTGGAGNASAGGPGGTGTAAAGGNGGFGGTPGPECGNDKTEGPDEECDDGNTDPLDGCSATCTVEDPDSCSATPQMVLDTGQTEVITYDLTGAANDTSNSTGSPECGVGSFSGGDHYWAVTPQSSGSLYVLLDASFDYHWLHMRAACPGTTDLNCDYSSYASTDDDFSVNVQAGTTYYVIVDSWDDTAGQYTLSVTLN